MRITMATSIFGRLIEQDLKFVLCEIITIQVVIPFRSNCKEPHAIVMRLELGLK